MGKDSVLRYARARLDDRVPVVFAHRYITRPADALNENHIALSESEFALRKRAGAFVMEWMNDGFHYGIGTEIHYWLATGLSVVVNGSRSYLATALDAYADMIILWITASSDIVAGRLARRGREDALGIEERLRHHQPPAIPIRPHGSVIHLNNNGPLAVAGDALIGLLTEQAAAAPSALCVPRAARKS